jgi:hypothetical protein
MTKSAMRFGALAISGLLLSTTQSCSEPNPRSQALKRAVDVARTPDAVVSIDLEARGGCRLDSLLAVAGDVGERGRPFPHVKPTFWRSMRDAQLWHEPSDEELTIPFTVEWILSRGSARLIVAFREAYPYSFGSPGTPPAPNPGPDPGVSKLAVLFEGHAWISDTDLREFLTDRGIQGMTRIGMILMEPPK